MKILLVAVAVGVGLCVFGLLNKQTGSFTIDDFIRESKALAQKTKKAKIDSGQGRPIGIKCTVSCDGKDVISVMEMFSVDDNKQWTKSTVTHKKAVSEFSEDSATQKKIQELKTNPMKFDM